ncbi:MAG: TolC family protein [Candidatus Hydrogenedentes bacterium]|nr:TolC family protein [Candidatus Hydrogenedentota bacterium]
MCSLCLAEETAPGGSDGVVLPEQLDLATAQRIALEQNPSLQAVEARVQQAEARVHQARAAYFPRVDASVSGSKTWISETVYTNARNAAFGGALGGLQSIFYRLGDPNASSFIVPQLLITGYQALEARNAVDDSLDNYRASFVATWLIFDGFGRNFSNRVARYGARETEAAYQEAKRLLLSGVATSFYGAQLAREDLEIAKADEAFNQRQLTEAKARRRVGTGSLSDELNFEVRVNAARAALIRAEQNYNVALIGLGELLGQPEQLKPETIQLAALTPESPDALERPEPQALTQSALEHRPEMAQSRYALQRTGASVGLRRAEFFPKVTASASKDATRTTDLEFREDDFATTVGVGVSYNLFAGGLNRARLTESKAARTEAERNLKAAEDRVIADVQQAVEDLKAAQDELKLQTENAGYVQRNRELVEKEYAAGQGSLVRLNQAQRDLVEAQGRLALARVSLRLAWYNLRSATGETVSEGDMAPDGQAK